MHCSLEVVQLRAGDGDEVDLESLGDVIATTIALSVISPVEIIASGETRQQRSRAGSIVRQGDEEAIEPVRSIDPTFLVCCQALCRFLGGKVGLGPIVPIARRVLARCLANGDLETEATKRTPELRLSVFWRGCAFVRAHRASSLSFWPK